MKAAGDGPVAQALRPKGEDLVPSDPCARPTHALIRGFWRAQAAEPMRSPIKARPNWPMAAMTWKISSPVGVAVSTSSLVEPKANQQRRR